MKVLSSKWVHDGVWSDAGVKGAKYVQQNVALKDHQNRQVSVRTESVGFALRV